MITRLVLDNFLAHEHTEIDFSAGVTVLSGMNNTGKSAVVEGIRCLATNPAPKFFIRHGAKEARVEAWFDTGERVAWIRRKTYAMYEVRVPGEEAPREYAKFGRKPPQDVLDILRLNLVDIESGDPVDVHIGDQRKPVFLLDQSGFAAASFFASSSESAYLLAMQRLLKTRIQDAKREKAAVESRMAGWAEELDALAELPRLGLECESLRKESRILEASEKALPALEKTLVRAEELRRLGDASICRLDILSRTQHPPELYPSAVLDERIQGLRRLQSAGTLTENRRQVLEKMDNPPDLFPVESLDRTTRRMDSARSTVLKQDRRASALKNLAPPPALFAAGELFSVLDERKRLSHAEQCERQRAEKMEGLVPPPVPEDLSRLAEAAVGLSRMRRQVAGAEESAREAGKRAEEFKRSMDARLAEIGRCPLCGNELSAELFAEKGCCDE